MTSSTVSPSLSQWIRLDGRRALVTGAAAGIGFAIAKMLSAQGAQIALLDRDASALARAQTVLSIRAEQQVHAFVCDVSDEQAVALAVESAERALAGLDIVINSAGVTSAPGMPFTNNVGADWDRVMAVNLKGSFFVCKAAALALKQSVAGRIVNISSITGLISAAYMPPYSVSKAALISLTKVLARDFAGQGVSVNALCPGFVWTPLWVSLGEEMAAASGGRQGANAREVFEARVREHVPMGKPQTLEEVAAMACFLCSDAAASVTGQVIGIDGGVSI